MYSELLVTLKVGVQPAVIQKPLQTSLGNASAPAAQVLAREPIAGYAGSAVGAAQYPNGTRIAFLCTDLDEVSVYVYADTLPRLKSHCIKAVKQLRGIDSINVKSATATILVPIRGTDVNILDGEETSWPRLFCAALADKFASKAVAAIVTACLAVVFFPPSSSSFVNGLIGLAATLVGVLFEAAHATFKADSWTWRES